LVASLIAGSFDVAIVQNAAIATLQHVSDRAARCALRAPLRWLRTCTTSTVHQ
jgi:hypothetical protein